MSAAESEPVNSIKNLSYTLYQKSNAFMTNFIESSETISKSISAPGNCNRSTFTSINSTPIDVHHQYNANSAHIEIEREQRDQAADAHTIAIALSTKQIALNNSNNAEMSSEELRKSIGDECASSSFDAAHREAKTSDNNTSIDEKIDATKHQQKKRKHRRGKKRRNHYNPYQMSCTEYEDKERERLQRKRDQLMQQGKTLAPFNTTQFIMDEHRDEAPVFDSVNSSDMDSDTTAEENYLNNEFNEEYEIVKMGYYKSLSKNELLQECFQILGELNRMQDNVSMLTKENESLKKMLRTNDIGFDEPESQFNGDTEIMEPESCCNAVEAESTV